MLNPVHLRTLQEVVRARSLAAAANRLGYTASAVSQQMAALEAATSTELFDRTARSIRPTAAARRLAARAEHILHELETLQHDLRGGVDGAPAPIPVGIFPSAALYLLPSATSDAEWQAAHARLSIFVADSTDLIRALTIARTIDLAFVYRFELSTLNWPPTAHVRHQWADPLVVLLPPGTPPAGGVRLADLAELPWITNLESTAGAMSIERIWARLGLTPRVVGRSDDYAVTQALVQAGIGAAIVPSIVARRPPAGVTVCRPRDLDAVREVVALTRPDADDPAVDLLVEAFGRQVDGM